jgi:hypothetical protein
MQQAALFRRERQFGIVNVVLWLFEVCGFEVCVLRFVVLRFVCVNQRDLRDTLWFLVCRLIEYSCMLFSRR